MNWYLVKLVYRFLYGHQTHAQQFNEQVRLILAEDCLHAFHKARLVGEREAMETGNTIIAWKFIDVTEIIPLHKSTDGAEIWSCINEETDAELYVRKVQKQSQALLQDGIGSFFNS
jgi:hypothetical protein